MRAHGMKRFCAAYLGAASLAGAALAGVPAFAQTPPRAEGSGQDVTVKGKRMPQAEAPRSATCVAMARDPHYRALMAAAGGDPTMGPAPYMPTRLPRNPDYNAPPKVAPGSALPDLGKARFGVSRTGEDNLGTAESDAVMGAFVDPGLSGPIEGQTSLDQAVLACQSAYTRGARGTGFSAPVAGLPALPTSSAGEFDPMSAAYERRVEAGRARYAASRALIAGRDTSLPMAFALFDQGRYAESLDWYRKAFDKLQLQEGGDEAALFMGKLYLQGLGDRSDPQEGVKWLKKAATAPFNPAMEMPIFDARQPERNTAVGEAAVILANVYRTGFGSIAKDPEESRRWYDRAADVGHVSALKMLGDIHYNGIDTPRDVKKAMGFYRKAAKLNHAGAQVALADILSAGEDGVAKDRKEALGWYQAAALSENPDALFALARAYDFGDGVKADPELAIGFYKSAALAGSVPARVAMGTYFYEGKLVPKDDAAARKWFDAAAEGADPDGMFNLGAMMANGQGGPRDLRRAWMWLNLAARSGHQNAAPAMAALERRMSPADRQAAAALLARGKAPEAR